MRVPKIELLIGIEVYATASLGIGGKIKQSMEDFVVEEVLVDGSRARSVLSGVAVDNRVLGSSSVRDRYLLCVMVKRNWDMFTALRNVSAQLGVHPDQICFAGIKDARALTAQYIAVEGATVEDIERVKVKDIEVKPIGYLYDKLSPFYLQGNSFCITISSVNHSRPAIEKRVKNIIEELQEIGGTPNFFGHQRFGTTRPITHLVGKAIIQGNLKKAAMLFLAKPFPYEHPGSRRSREELGNRLDFREALKDFPKQLRYERLMLRHLGKRPDDFAGAFRRLPVKLQQLFVQAYQSYLFNRFLSKRIANGLRLDAADAGDYVVGVERSGLPALKTGKLVDAETRFKTNKAIRAGHARLAVPVVGFKQQPSKGAQGEIEKRTLEDENINPKDFRIKEIPAMSARGELRTALAPVHIFSLNEISRDQTETTKNKVNVSFMLYRGSYATVVLRELMKPCNPIKAGY